MGLESSGLFAFDEEGLAPDGIGVAEARSLNASYSASSVTRSSMDAIGVVSIENLGHAKTNPCYDQTRTGQRRTE